MSQHNQGGKTSVNPQSTILVLGTTGKAGAKTAQILAESGDVKVVAEFFTATHNHYDYDKRTSYPSVILSGGLREIGVNQ
ncbi:hypothetical protein [Gloeocapsopsis dulcis]|uniref:Uncharacterized protein n=1 Tax=Gloeocapsopsis dulcis AAB1 = 1H9 TaxID=1433147 RepID=A0A6N8FZM6_9CHRO|nr:hypothetical protein [Gloeocapsopsis dulcis]MUL37557.1 hypothetical protein [Gloeocapsopsis dulcis AAB1 = 1H9]WNN87970.1 hypothetical protein P0S91_16890 [Gloeocapsopsis dulcis]